MTRHPRILMWAGVVGVTPGVDQQRGGRLRALQVFSHGDFWAPVSPHGHE